LAAKNNLVSFVLNINEVLIVLVFWEGISYYLKGKTGLELQALLQWEGELDYDKL